MSFIKKFANLFQWMQDSGAGAHWVYVRCNRCGEKIRTRLNLHNDLSVSYEGGKKTYFCRKYLIGDQGCFQQVIVELTFDQNRKVIQREIQGGQFLSAAEYAQD